MSQTMIDKKVNRSMIKVTILVLTFVQMATNGLSPAMSDIAARFPDVAASTIQLLMTLPGIFVVVLSLISAWLTSRIPKKYLIGTGSICITATGILGVLFHDSLGILFAWSCLMGIGMGLVSALTVSLISDYFEGQEKANLTGLQTGAANVGGMIMTAVGGFLTAIAWHLDYLVYLLAIPGLILLILFVPKKNPERKADMPSDDSIGKRSLASGPLLKNKMIWLPIIISFLLLFMFNAGPTNLAMYVSEYGIGTPVLSGWAATVFLLGGTLMGIAFGVISKWVRAFTVPLGFLFMAAGFGVMIIKPNVVCLLIGCLLAGMSISLASPQCILHISELCSSSQELALAAALIMAASNAGTFFTPQITNIARLISGNDGTVPRFIAVIVLAIVMAVITGFFSIKGWEQYRPESGTTIR